MLIAMYKKLIFDNGRLKRKKMVKMTGGMKKGRGAKRRGMGGWNGSRDNSRNEKTESEIQT